MKDFRVFEEYMSEQAKYEAGVYIECLDDGEKALKVKGMDSVLLIIIEMRTTFGSSSAYGSFKTTIIQHSSSYLSFYCLFPNPNHRGLFF